jgi:hypothetical protein
MKTLDGAFALSGARKTLSESRRWEVDALLAGYFLEIVPMAMREVAVVAAVSTDISRIILGNKGTTRGSPDICPASSTGSTVEITR